ncbi:MAG: hypothetical protein ABR861_07145 [Terriglobales bacterium]|jgi:hypothetical protein
MVQTMQISVDEKRQAVWVLTIRYGARRKLPLQAQEKKWWAL